MKPVDKLQADRQRHAQAVESALNKTTLLKNETDKGQLLGDERQKDAFVNKVFAHHESPASSSSATPTGKGASGSSASGPQPAPGRTPGRPPAVLPPTQTLLEKVKAGKEQDHQTEVTMLQAERAALIAQYKKLEQEAEAIYAARRATKQSLQAALKDDERLENLGPKAVLREFVAEGRTALDHMPVQLGSTVSTATTERHAQAGTLDTGAARARARAEIGQGMQGQQEAQAEEEEEEGEEEEESDTEDDEEEEEEGEGAGGSGSRADVPDWQQELDAVLKSKKHSKRVKSASASPSKVPILQAETTGSIIKMLRSGDLGPEGASAALNSLVAALQLDVPDQEEALHALRLHHQVATTRLNWAQHRPATYERTFTASVHQKAIKQLCAQQVDELIEMAWAAIRMRPTKEQVQAEIQEWKASRMLRLQDVARHVADSVLKDCVDEIIAEVSSEVTVLHKASEGWSDDLLVEAVATVMGGMSAGGAPGGNSAIRTTLLKAAAEHEAAVVQARQLRVREETARAQAAAARQAAGTAGTARDGARDESDAQAVSYLDPEDVIMQGMSTQRTSRQHAGPGAAAAEAGSESGTTSQRTSSQARASNTVRSETSDREIRSHFIDVTSHLPGPAWNPAANQLPPRVIRPDGTLGEVMEVGPAPTWCAIDTLARADAQQHYLLGLKAILHEMRRVRGSAVHGHTQKLTLSWPAGLRPTQAQLAAADAAVPPLAASLSVWRSRSTKNQHKCGLAVYPKPEAIKLSVLETDFWTKVTFRPFFLGEKSPLVWVGKHLGVITCMAPSPQGTLLAVGTEGGALLVYDLKSHPSNPWFQVVGDAGTGHLPKGAKGINLGQPLMNLTWSRDGYQVAAVDAGHRMRVWWMRPAPGQKVGVGEERQPVLPQLIASVGPQHMAASGKAPLEDALEDAGAAKRPAAKAWPITFAHEFTLLGTQPSLLLPQVTGDVLKLTTRTSASALLPSPLPKSLTQEAGVGAGEAGCATHLQPSTADFLLSAKAASKPQYTQCLYRSHDSKVVFIGYLNDATTLVTLDTRGVIHLWRCQESQRTGMGWFKPINKWVLPTSVKAYQPRGQGYPVWPTTQAVAGPPIPTGGGFLSWLGFGAPAQPAGVPAQPEGPPPPSFQDYMSDPQLHDTEDEVRRLRSDPQGSWLAAARLPWLVRYVWDTEVCGAAAETGWQTGGAGGEQGWSKEATVQTLVDKRGRLVRQEIRRPHPQMGADKPLLVSCYSVPGGSLISRQKQSAVLIKQDFQVVSAGMNESRSDLVVWLRHTQSPGAALKGPWSVMSAHVIHMHTRRPITPRIEVYDHSHCGAAPAWALSPPINTLGSEYLCVGLGGGVLGMYSVATGQTVRELNLGMPTTSSHFTALSLFGVQPAQGSCLNHGKMLLAAVPSGSLYVHMYHIDDQVGTLDAVSRRPQPPLVRVLPHPGPQRPPSGPPHPGASSIRRQPSLPAASSASSPGHAADPNDQGVTASPLPAQQPPPQLLSRDSYDSPRPARDSPQGMTSDASRVLRPSGSLPARDSRDWNQSHSSAPPPHTSAPRPATSTSVPSPAASGSPYRSGEASGNGSRNGSAQGASVQASKRDSAGSGVASPLQQQLSQRSSRQLAGSSNATTGSPGQLTPSSSLPEAQSTVPAPQGSLRTTPPAAGLQQPGLISPQTSKPSAGPGSAQPQGAPLTSPQRSQAPNRAAQ